MKKYRKSFIKWAGGKSRQLDRIMPLLCGANRLHEPFAGSAVVSLNHDRAGFVSDVNLDLMEMYQAVCSDPDAFIADCRALFEGGNDSELYYERRTQFNKCISQRRRAALFLYLNRHGFNGLCRFNKSGGFNVPFGKYKSVYFPESEIRDFGCRMQGCVYMAGKFEAAFIMAERGDAIYCDPPYVPLSETADFTSYSAGGFGMEDQERLAQCADQARGNGVKVVISNHDTPFTRTLYSGADEHQYFDAARRISCKVDSRQPVGEVLAVYRP